jgi:hypothetical protein
LVILDLGIQPHFGYLIFTSFQWSSICPIWTRFGPQNLVPIFQDTSTLPIPKKRIHLGVLGFIHLQFHMLVKVCLSLETFYFSFNLFPCHAPTLVMNPKLGSWHLGIEKNIRKWNYEDVFIYYINLVHLFMHSFEHVYNSDLQLSNVL